MVNQVRTCLLNLSAWTGDDRPPGEEYVPTDYVPRTLTGTPAAVRQALFGPGADRAGMNLTLARLMAHAHASPLWRGATADDARITYDPTRPNRVFDSLGPTASGPTIAGWQGAARFPAAGRGYGAWTVVTDGAGGYTVTPIGSSAPETGEVGSAGGDVVPLPGSTLHLVVPANASGTWSVTLTARPAHSFATLADRPDLSTLFRPTAGGYETDWFRTWSGDGPPALRSAAVALALAARIYEQGV